MQAFSEAKKLFARGYPVRYIAWVVGVNRNTVSAWGKVLGYSRSWDEGTNPRRILGAFRRVQRMPAKDREAFFRLLDLHSLLPRRSAS